MKNIKAKRITTTLLCILLCACMLLCLGSLWGTAVGVRAETYSDTNTVIEINQGQFDASTSTAPVSPSGWTGGYIGGASGNVVGGIISLDANYTENYDKLKLDIYPEFADKHDFPATPFGGTGTNPSVGSYYPGTNKNVLMINTNLSKTAYGYSSESISLEANSFYKFSAWVKTGLFGASQGAAVTLTGLDQPVGMWNIDTVASLKTKDNGSVTWTNLPDLNESNNYGFAEQIIYVATGSNSESVSLNLSVGDYADADHYFLSKGYAFFANVKATQMTATNFYHGAYYDGNKDNVYVYDMNSSNAVMIESDNQNPFNENVKGTLVDVGSFTKTASNQSGLLGWKKITDSEWVDNINWGIYNGGKEYIEGLDGFGLTSDPYSPTGRFDTVNNTKSSNNILVLSSYQGDNSFASVAAGVTSAGIRIEKESFYRLSVWYNTQEGASATVQITGQSTSYSSQYKLGPFTNSDLTSGGGTSRYGWQSTSFNIKGSIYKDVLINVELWLGNGTAKSSGIAMFDNITLDKLTAEEYQNDSFGGTTVAIDSGSSAVNSVTNGDFSETDFGDDNPVYPLAPTAWTYITTNTAGTNGHSSRAVNTDNVISGVAPTDSNHYNRNLENYNYIENPRPYGGVFEYVNVLLMASSTDTAFAYRSSSIAITGGSDYKLNVNLLSKLEGYGASLVLKNGSSIVSTIEGINTGGNQFRDYSFYISGAAGEANLTLEIWFGMTDKGTNSTKLTRGHMFINTVTLDALTANDSGVTEFAEKYNQYNSYPASSLSFAAYRLGAYDANSYDRYSRDTVKEMYDMTITRSSGTHTREGVIVLDSIPSGDNIIPDYLYTEHVATENHFNNIIYLQNINSGYSRFAADSTIGLTASSYYKLDFSLLVALEGDPSDNAVGAGIWLGGDGFDDIRDTYKTPATIGAGGEKINEYEFQTFSFYYAVGSEDTPISWSLTLGGGDKLNEAISGRVFLNYILVTQIDQSTYESETETILGDEEDSGEQNTHVRIVNKIDADIADEDVDTDTDTETDNDTGENEGGCQDTAWYLIPSILFAVAIFIALFGVLFKKLRAKHPGKKRGEKVVSYDRKETYAPVGSRDTSTEGGTSDRVTYTAADTSYDTFDDTDDAPTAPTTPAPKRAPTATKFEHTETTKESVETTVNEEEPSTEEPTKKQTFDNEFDD